MAELKVFAHLLFILQRRITEAEAHEETILLRFRQEKSAFLLDGVLRSEDHERVGHLVSDASGGDAGFTHRFEQRGLGARAGAVDFVNENKLSEERTETEFHAAFIAGRSGLAENVRGLEVGGALDAFEGAA